MSLVLYHHPWSRAAGVVWQLEEVGEPYELRFVDLMGGEQKKDDHRGRNRMMKVPVLKDGDSHIAETAAIGVYLGDRYALGRLAPQLDAADRGAYLRWCFFAPSVLEMACMAKMSGWEYKPSQAGFGTYDDVLATLDEALAEGPYLLGEEFTMADCLVGGTIRWFLQFKMIDRTDNIGAYADRLGERPALQKANTINEAIAEEHGLNRG